ncbi:MAG TPA: cupin domain-containing protein [Candidatus Sulfotelmatobacter sp.]|nr:cupin domain-containing protein [Candidatus Sulfotelmatobacter sp.]
MAKKGYPRSTQPGSVQTASAATDPTMARSVSRENAEHYRWGKDCDAWYLVNDPQLSVIEEFMPPGAAEIRHHHQKAQQFFYILSGEVLMEVEGETTLLGAGSGIRILPGKHHQIRNPSSGAVRFLVISHPRSHGDRIDD